MNLPNKITLSRIIMTVLIIILLVFPFDLVGIEIPVYTVNNTINMELNVLISGVLFILASVTDFIDGKLARSRNLVTDTGKMLDAIADKVLVNSVLIIFAANGFIPSIVAVIYVFRDEVVNALKMHSAKGGTVVAASMSGKIKTFAMMTGLSLLFFYNLPFELLGIGVAKFLIYFATLMSVISGVEYYNAIMKKNNK